MTRTVFLLWAVVIISISTLLRAEEMEVIEPPVIVAHSVAPVLAAGSRLSLSCAAFGSPTPNITWSSPARGIPDFELYAATSDAISIYTEEVTDVNGNVYVISVLELCAADSYAFTEYTCFATNGISIAEEGIGEASATFEIIPTGIEPAILLAHPDDEFNYNGRRLSLPCLAFGSPPPVISWSSSVIGDLDDESVNIYSEEFEDINGTPLVLSTLELCNSDLSDFTEYTCTATNAIEDQIVGTTSATFDLIPQVQNESVTYTQRQLTAELQISFSGLVDVEQVGCDLKQLTFLDAFVPSTNFTPMYPGSCEPATETSITAILDMRDYITLLGLGATLFSSADNSFLVWNPQLIGPPLTLIESEGNAVQVVNFIFLTAALQITGFDIDYNDELIAIHFNSLVIVPTFTATDVTLSADDTGAVNYTLVDSSVSTDTSLASIVCIALGSVDLASISGLGLCTSPSNCLATVVTNAVNFVGNTANVAMNLQVSVLREASVFPRPNVYFVLTIETGGCKREVQLTEGETSIVRETERVTRMDCFTNAGNPTLSWDQGGLPLNTRAPDSSLFILNWPDHTYAEFPDGIPVYNYGLYTCTSERGAYVQHYIHNINQFVGLPLGNLLLPEFYYPISYPIRVAAIPQLSDGDITVTIQPDGHTPLVNPAIDTYSHGATISYDNALYSLNGAYIITVDVSGPVPFSTTAYLNITVQGYSPSSEVTKKKKKDVCFQALREGLDPIVTIVPPVIVIRVDDTESLVHVTCSPSHPDLPVRWMAGSEDITANTTELTLFPQNVHHTLAIDLSSGIELGDTEFSCLLDNPEDSEEVVAADVAMVRIVPNDITILRDGTEVLEDNTVLSSVQAEGDLRLECLSTQDNYNLDWVVNTIFTGPADAMRPEIFTESNINRAYLTVNEYGMFEGTFRCVSLDSGLAVNIHLSRVPQLCQVDVDPVWNIAWDRTLVGFTDTQPCPETNDRPATGIAYRSCNTDGTWSETVNLTQCFSEEFAQIEYMADTVFNGASPPGEEEVVELTAVLADATRTAEGVALFPMELNVANNIAGDTVEFLMENVATSTSVNTELVDVFSNVLSDNNLDSWRQLQQAMGVGSQQLLQNMEDFGSYLAEAVNSTLISQDNITVERGNIIIQAQKISSGVEVTDIMFPAMDNALRREAQFRLPASLLTESGANVAVNALFKNIEEILPIMNMDTDTRAVTRVLSSQLFSPPSANTGSGEQELAELAFTTAAVERSTAPRCVFWEYSIPIGNGAWETRGVETTITMDRGDGSFDIRCTSTHFTNFAVLVDVLSADEEFSFTVPVYVGCGILLLCSVLAILILTVVLLLSCVKGVYVGIHYFVHLSFAFALMCAYIAFVAGLTRATENRAGCVAVAALLQYFFTASFSWMLCEAIILSVMLVVADFQRISKVWWLVLFIFGWGLPAIPTAVSVGVLHDDYGTNAFCWISLEEGVSSRVLWAFAAPKLAIILVTAIFLMISFGCTCKFLGVKLKDSAKRADFFRAWILLCGTVFLILLLAATWVFALLLVDDINNVSAWPFMAFSTALGITFVIITVIVVILDQACGTNKTESDVYRRQTSSQGDEKYWSDREPILSEANAEAKGLYEMTQKTGTSTVPNAQKPENEYIISNMDASASLTQPDEEKKETV